MSGQIITTRQLVERCKVDHRTVMRWALYPGFPGVACRIPVERAHFTNGYDWAAVRAWLVETDRWDDVIDAPSGYVPGRPGRPSVPSRRKAS